MIAYYLYGRGKDGYMNYNPYYTKTDEDHYFSKMAGYTGRYEENQPEKRFYYQIQTQENGKCCIVGKSSFVKMYSSILSGARDTVFSFQYLISEEKRKELLNNPALLYKYDRFPDNMDQVHRTKEGNSDISVDNAVFDLEYYFTNQMKPSLSLDEYSVFELLDAFNIDEQKLQELIWTLLLFNTDEKVYFILPENTKQATDKAYALMCRLLTVLPEVIVSKNGFVTYVNKAEMAGADFVPFEIRYMFLANTRENINICKSTKSAYVFCQGCETGVEIPEGMQALVECIAQSFVSGKLDFGVQDLWGALNTYLKPDAVLPVSAVEYCTLNDYCKIYRTIALEENETVNLDVSAVWHNIDILRSMSKQRTKLWNNNLEQALMDYVQRIIDVDCVDETDEYKRIIEEYETDRSLQTCIENYFFRRVTDYELLEKYLTALEACPELKKKVYDHFLDMLEEMLDSGTLDKSMYTTVLEIYDEYPHLQNKIQIFFEKLIVDEEIFEYIQKLFVESASESENNLKLWRQIESAVYSNEDNYAFIMNREINRATQVFSDGRLDEIQMFQGLWECVRSVYELNRTVLCDRAYFTAIQTVAFPVLERWIIPTAMRSILAEAQSQINKYNLPNEYNKLFSDASRNYLVNYRNKICFECDDSELFNRWPFAESGSINIAQIKTSLQNKKLQEDSIKQFENIINQKNSAYVCRFMKEWENERILAEISRSESLEHYIALILKRLEHEVVGRDKKNSGKECYEELCMLLVLKFRRQQKQVFHYVMQSRYGGVCAMSSIYTLLCQNARTYSLTKDERSEITTCMHQEICLFFEQYKMSSVDKKSIKAEKEFLEKMGLSYKELRKL